jgi:hypothetical protein
LDISTNIKENEMKLSKRDTGAVILFVLALILAIFMTSKSAAATEGNEEPCVPQDGWTETIEHPAVTEVVHHEAVTHTEYHFRKFTRTKTKSFVPGVEEIWANFSPNKENKPFVGPPTWPNDPRGTWQIHDDIPGGHAGPDGVYQKGSGNSSWFYRLNGTSGSYGEWTDFGPWTPWEPESHTSWELSDAPLGTPQFHGQGTYQDGTKWYREWQALADGLTREIVDEEAWDETVVVEEAWTEVIEHPAVDCPPDTPEQPDPEVTSTSSTSYECGDDFQVTTTVTTTTEYVLDEELNEWVLGVPVEEVTVTEEPVEVVPCDKPDEPKDPEGPKDEPKDEPAPVKNVAVPTAVDAGL